ncbi:hypothetical protein SBOR_2111 [Sclerotinia borealis F-4128]|uniref:C2H2-type domain-containing protein n=1 Tax=Sclerotinia borealis (strain F-4128) TaxID=1432307 RepID=W9CSJ4_SCLBF|nr:hypothetical protein SBOR_2111 [Sclerotinia borealis F-4128]
MSSLKDIMDVDVDPLESQAYRRKEAAQQQASRPSIDPSSQSPSPQLDDTKGKSSINSRRSNRVSKSSTQSTTSRPHLLRRRSSGTGEVMDFSAYQGGGSNQGSLSGSPLQPSTRGGMDSMVDIVPVKYTPVTGRISKARKGMPVHTCDDYVHQSGAPQKQVHGLIIVLFDRRRHKLSHGKPAYPCTFEDCERTFHRPDLLARHLNRHETQGEKAYKSSDPRSRASSSASESALKLDSTPRGMSMVLGQMSPNDSMTPRTSGGAENSAAAATFNTITSNFQAVDFSSADSHRGSASQAQLTGTEAYTAASSEPVSSRTSSSYGEMTSTFNVRPMPKFSDQDPYRATSTSFQGLYPEEASSFQSYSDPHALPLLRIPEEPYMPGMSYTQETSPWCSSASDSTHSTQSESSRTGRMTYRGRSGSLVTAPEWSISVLSTQWPHGMANTTQDLRSPPYETVMQSYEAPYTPPRMSPPSRQLLDVPGFGGYYMESVGNPQTSTYNKHLAQTFLPASPSRLSNPRLAILNRRSKELVGSQQLETLTNIGTNILSPSQSATSNLDIYLSLYWINFDKLFPFIHRGTYIQNQDLLLTFAMAAIGTQYHPNSEARKHGVEFHAYCTRTIPLALDWTPQVMQAILLTEIFTRFRGKKTTTRLSRQFEELYNRLLNSSYPTSETSTTPINSSTPDGLVNHFNASTRFQDIQGNWLLWVDTESQKRLLCLCFIFDIHQAMYHQQKQAVPDLGPAMLDTPCSEVLWDFTNAADWATNETRNNAGQPLHAVQHQFAQEGPVELSHFARSLIICFLTSQLPGGANNGYQYPDDFQIHNTHATTLELVTLFPESSMVHTYLALYNTPLYDLLIISGDTWVFSQKITHQNYFREAQSRLKTWSSSLAAATATHHACRILLSEFSTPYIPSDHNTTSCSLDLSHYWSLNVAALICWAFGHRASGSSGTSSRHGLDTFTDLDFNSSPEASEKLRLKALTYLDSMLELDTKDLLTGKATMRKETSPIIDAVRTRLEIDSAGGNCMSLVDSICVLRRLRESGRGKWF